MKKLKGTDTADWAEHNYTFKMGFVLYFRRRNITQLSCREVVPLDKTTAALRKPRIFSAAVQHMESIHLKAASTSCVRKRNSKGENTDEEKASYCSDSYKRNKPFQPI